MPTEPSNLFVVCLGVGVVFIGLVCIVILCKILSAICALGNKKTDTATVAPTTAKTDITKPIENKQEIIASVSAVIAEELGTDISAIRILSFKKI